MKPDHGASRPSRGVHQATRAAPFRRARNLWPVDDRRTCHPRLPPQSRHSLPDAPYHGTTRLSDLARGARGTFYAEVLSGDRVRIAGSRAGEGATAGIHRRSTWTTVGERGDR